MARNSGRAWETFDTAGAVARLAIQGGWIVRTAHGGCFVPDISHEWDIGDLLKEGTTQSGTVQRTLVTISGDGSTVCRISVIGGWVCSIASGGCCFIPDETHSWDVGEERAASGFYQGKMSNRYWEYCCDDNTVKRFPVGNGWIVFCVTQEGVFFVRDEMHNEWVVGAEYMS